MLKISSSGTSNAGKKKINEDNFYMNGIFAADNNAASGRIYSDNTQRDMQFYAVFDGLGDDIKSDMNPNIDFRDGDRASFVAADMLSRLQRHLKTKEEYNLNEYIYRFVKKTNNSICEDMKQRKLWTGTSFALLCINGNTAYAYNIGNSKIFLLRDNRLSLISRNDTRAESLVLAKQISADIVRHTPDNKILTQYLGMYENEKTLDLHINRINLRNGDKFLICSDGLCDLPGERIYQIMSRDMSEQEIVTDLTNEAARGGAEENLALVVVGVNYSDRTSNKSNLLKPTSNGPTHFSPLTFRNKIEFKPKHVRQIILGVILLTALIIVLSVVLNAIIKSDEEPTNEPGSGTGESQTSGQGISDGTGNMGNTGDTGNMVITTPEGNTFNIPTEDEDETFETTETTTAEGTVGQTTTAAPTTVTPAVNTTQTPTNPPVTTSADTTEITTETETEITTEEITSETAETEDNQTTEESATEPPSEEVTEPPTEEPETEIPTEEATEPPTESPTDAPTEEPTPLPETQPPTIAEETIAEE